MADDKGIPKSFIAAIAVAIMAVLIFFVLGLYLGGATIVNLEEAERNSLTNSCERDKLDTLRDHQREIENLKKEYNDGIQRIAERNRDLIELNRETQEQYNNLFEDLNYMLHDINATIADLNFDCNCN